MTAHRVLVFLRHGETVGQSSIRYFGSTDVPLSHQGREQMHCAANAAAAYRPQRVYTSNLVRTRAAAAIVAPGIPAVALPDLNEIHFGDWEGLTREEIAHRYPELYRRWLQLGDHFQYPNGECRSHFRQRVVGAVQTLLRDNSSALLVLTHRGVISRALMYLLPAHHALIDSLEIALGSIHVVATRNRTEWEPVTLDDTRHLAPRPPYRSEAER